MKTKYFIILVLCLIGTYSFAQDIIRTEVTGRVIVDRNELEGITVYNSSSNKGTVTDNEGGFKLNVALNDRVEFAALQFQDFEVVITKEIISSKSMIVYLVEQVNKLDEVIILPHDLVGNLNVDTKSITLVNPDLDALYFGLANLDKMEFFDGYSTRVDNIALQSGTLKYQADFVKILGTLLKPFLKPELRKNDLEFKSKQTILEMYSKEYLKNILSISEKHIVEFIFYVEEQDFDFNLLDPKREMEFLEFLKSQEQKFALIKYGEE